MTGPSLGIVGTLGLIGGVLAALGLLDPVAALIIMAGLVGLGMLAALIYTLTSCDCPHCTHKKEDTNV